MKHYLQTLLFVLSAANFGWIVGNAVQAEPISVTYQGHAEASYTGPGGFGQSLSFNIPKIAHRGSGTVEVSGTMSASSTAVIIQDISQWYSQVGASFVNGSPIAFGHELGVGYIGDTITHSDTGSGGYSETYVPNATGLFSYIGNGIAEIPATFWYSNALVGRGRLTDEEVVGSANFSADATVTYTFEPNQTADLNAIRLGLSDPSVADKIISTYAYDANPIGEISEVNGDVTVTRAGATVLAELGFPIYEGDIVETFGNGAANIAFVDDTNFAVSENARLAVDEYVFDPASTEGNTDFSILKGVFVFTSGLIGREDPDDVTIDTPVGSIGFRGDAREVIQQDLLNNPTPELGEVGIAIETASPMQIVAPVKVPDGSFDLSFDYIFLDEEGTFTVRLGDTDLFQVIADPSMQGLEQTHSMELEWDTDFLTELVFEIDGTAGLGLVVKDVRFPGLDLRSLDQQWFTRGNGDSGFVLIQTEAQAAELERRIAANNVVPEPSSILLMTIAFLALLPFIKRKKC